LTRHNRPSIGTYTGIEFFPWTPEQESINITDISKALSNICRYMGHCDFYSVAEHSVLVMELLKIRCPGSKFLHQCGLLHDASEAYIFDLPSPVKEKLPEYKALERTIEEAVQEKFLRQPPTELEVSRVKQADKDIFLLEWQALWSYKNIDWWSPELPPIDTAPLTVICMDPSEARSLFMESFEELFE